MKVPNSIYTSARSTYRQYWLVIVTMSIIVSYAVTSIDAMIITKQSGNMSEQSHYIHAPLFKMDNNEFNHTASVRLPVSNDWSDCASEDFQDNRFVLIAAPSRSCFYPDIIHHCRQAPLCPGVLFVTQDRVPGFTAMLGPTLRVDDKQRECCFVEISKRDGDWIKEELESNYQDTSLTVRILFGEYNQWTDFITSWLQRLLSSLVASFSALNIMLMLYKISCGMKKTRRYQYLNTSIAGGIILGFELIGNLLRIAFLFNLSWCHCLQFGWQLMVEFGGVAPMLISRLSVGMCWRNIFASYVNLNKASMMFARVAYFISVSVIFVISVVFGVIEVTLEVGHMQTLSVFFCLLLLSTSIGFIWQYSSMSQRGYLDMGEETSSRLRRMATRALLSSYLVLGFVVGMLTISLPWRGEPKSFITVMWLVHLVAGAISTFNIFSVEFNDLASNDIILIGGEQLQNDAMMQPQRFTEAID